VPDIADVEFAYHLVVDGHLLESRLISRGPLSVGDPFPLAEGGGTVTAIVRDDDGSYLIHVEPIL
jgi:hypothetical protein